MITSASNPRIQFVRGLLARRKEREQARAFVVEGVRLVEEALSAAYEPQLTLFSSALGERGKLLLAHPALASSEVLEVTPDLLASVSGTETPQGILSVLRMKPSALPEALDFVVVADGIRDPGNLGTLLRSAAAAGAQAVLLAPATTDAYAPKVVRSGMGAHFRLPIVELGWEAIRDVLKDGLQSLTVYLAESERGKALWNADLHQPLALLIGGEAEGASPQGIALADELIRIPMPGGSESLNAAVAASILIFEVVRQRHS